MVFKTLFIAITCLSGIYAQSSCAGTPESCTLAHDSNTLLQKKVQVSLSQVDDLKSEEMSQLAKFAKPNAIAKDLEGTVLTETITSDPDEDDDGHMPTPDSPASPPDAPGNQPSNLLSTNATRKATGESCPAQPSGWHSCAWGKVYGEPAYCGSSNRYTLNGGVPMNFQACAFLTAQTSGCSNYFYTTSTASDVGGVCKCCKQGPSESPYYVSNSCNYVYYASPSCKIR